MSYTGKMEKQSMYVYRYALALTYLYYATLPPQRKAQPVPPTSLALYFSATLLALLYCHPQLTLHSVQSHVSAVQVLNQKGKLRKFKAGAWGPMGFLGSLGNFLLAALIWKLNKQHKSVLPGLPTPRYAQAYMSQFEVFKEDGASTYWTTQFVLLFVYCRWVGVAVNGKLHPLLRGHNQKKSVNYAEATKQLLGLLKSKLSHKQSILHALLSHRLLQNILERADEAQCKTSTRKLLRARAQSSPPQIRAQLPQSQCSTFDRPPSLSQESSKQSLVGSIVDDGKNKCFGKAGLVQSMIVKLPPQQKSNKLQGDKQIAAWSTHEVLDEQEDLDRQVLGQIRTAPYGIEAQILGDRLNQNSGYMARNKGTGLTKKSSIEDGICTCVEAQNQTVVKSIQLDVECKGGTSASKTDDERCDEEHPRDTAVAARRSLNSEPSQPFQVRPGQLFDTHSSSSFFSTSSSGCEQVQFVLKHAVSSSGDSANSREVAKVQVDKGSQDGQHGSQLLDNSGCSINAAPLTDFKQDLENGKAGGDELDEELAVLPNLRKASQLVKQVSSNKLLKTMPQPTNHVDHNLECTNRGKSVSWQQATQHVQPSAGENAVKQVSHALSNANAPAIVAIQLREINKQGNSSDDGSSGSSTGCELATLWDRYPTAGGGGGNEEGDDGLDQDQKATGGGEQDKISEDGDFEQEEDYVFLGLPDLKQAKQLARKSTMKKSSVFSHTRNASILRRDLLAAIEELAMLLPHDNRNQKTNVEQPGSSVRAVPTKAAGSKDYRTDVESKISWEHEHQIVQNQTQDFEAVAKASFLLPHDQLGSQRLELQKIALKIAEQESSQIQGEVEIDRARFLASDERLQEFADLAQEMNAILAEVAANDSRQGIEGKSILTVGKPSQDQSYSDVEKFMVMNVPEKKLVGQSGGGMVDSPVWGLALNYRDCTFQDAPQENSQMEQALTQEKQQQQSELQEQEQYQQQQLQPQFSVGYNKSLDSISLESNLPTTGSAVLQEKRSSNASSLRNEQLQVDLFQDETYNSYQSDPAESYHDPQSQDIEQIPLENSPNQHDCTVGALEVISEESTLFGSSMLRALNHWEEIDEKKEELWTYDFLSISDTSDSSQPQPSPNEHVNSHQQQQIVTQELQPNQLNIGPEANKSTNVGNSQQQTKGKLQIIQYEKKFTGPQPEASVSSSYQSKLKHRSPLHSTPISRAGLASQSNVSPTSRNVLDPKLRSGSKIKEAAPSRNNQSLDDAIFSKGPQRHGTRALLQNKGVYPAKQVPTVQGGLTRINRQNSQSQVAPSYLRSRGNGTQIDKNKVIAKSQKSSSTHVGVNQTISVAKFNDSSATSPGSSGVGFIESEFQVINGVSSSQQQRREPSNCQPVQKIWRI